MRVRGDGQTFKKIILANWGGGNIINVNGTHHRVSDPLSRSLSLLERPLPLSRCSQLSSLEGADSLSFLEFEQRESIEKFN